MKTVLQELIEQLEKTVPEVKNGNVIDKSFWIDKEKQQIKDAFEAGENNIDFPALHGYGKLSNVHKYYTENYESRS